MVSGINRLRNPRKRAGKSGAWETFVLKVSTMNAPANAAALQHEDNSVDNPVDTAVDNQENDLLKQSAASGVKFSDFDLPAAVHGALAKMNYDTPTKIQAMAIPVALQGRDILGSAQTGTGKTAAFSIPMIANLINNPQAMALVLAPTRELAAQTLEVVRKLTTDQRDLKTALLIGGEAMGKQFDQLRRNPRIIIGTPGRINDHLRRNGKLLAKVNFIAIDEADRMLDMGFAPQIDEVLECVNKERQTLLFSATFPEEIVRFSKKYLNNPERVAVSAVKANAPKIKHEMIKISDSEKYAGLRDQIEIRQGSIIIFVKTQHGTERLAKRLDGDGMPSIVIHGGLRQAARDRAVREFRQQRSRILIATDVAARGLDIPHIEHVINYDLPQVAEDYIHRIGRTGRNGAEGNAMCFVIPSETGKWNAINRILNPGAAPERRERSEGGNGRGQGRGQRPSRDGGERDYRNASGFNSRKAKPRNDNYRGDREDSYESRSGGRTERSNFRDNDFRDNRGNDRNNDRGFRGNSEGQRTPTDKNWNAKEGRKEYRSEFRNDFHERPRSERPQGERSYGDRPRGERSFGERSYAGNRENNGNREGGNRSRSDRGFGERNFGGERSYGDKPRSNAKRPSGKAVFSKPNRGEGYSEGRGDGYEGNNRSENFGVKPRGNAGKPKSGKPAQGKKPFVFKGNSRKPGGRAAGSRSDA